MQLDLQNLPNDPALLQQMILDLLGTLDDHKRQIDQLKHQLAQLRRHQFGRRSEKIDTGQLLLAFAQLQQAEAQAKAAQRVANSRPATPPREKPNGHGRRALPEDLPRERIAYPLPEQERICPDCGQVRDKMGEEVTEQLDYVPASFVVRQHVRIKYACKQCQANVVTSRMPAQPIEKGIPGPGLLAHVLVSKYADHLPLHRQESIFRRHGIDLSRSTLCDWVGGCADLLEPLVKAMKAELVLSHVIQTDDTPVPVLDATRVGTREGRLWVYVGDADHPYTLFDYTPTRKRDGPAAYLAPYQGYLQADAYAGYDGIYAGGEVTEVGCWAHARRKSFDARTSDSRRAHVALAYIQQLYKVEDKARGLDADARHAMRQEQSRPILVEFGQWLEAEQMTVLPKSPMGEAIGYARRQWAALNRYLDDGRLEIDNNAAERALRAIAIGRKNWLFAGSDEGGRRAAIIYSLIGTCKRHGVEPFAYLRDVLERVSTHPQSGIAALLPHHWQAAQDLAASSGPVQAPSPQPSDAAAD